LRSALAHGGSYTKDLKWLWQRRPTKDEDKYLNESQALKWFKKYLRTLVKRVLLQAMREPQLITDLKG